MKLEKKESMYVSMSFFSQFQIRSGMGKSRGCLAPGHIMYGRKDGLDEMGKDGGMGLMEGA